MGNKSIVKTYILWLLFGWTGYHHFYLRRDCHGLVWMLTLGGFILGWIRDVWRIPEYVRDANNEPTFIAEYIQKIQLHKGKPRLRWCRALAAICIGSLLGLTVRLAVPLKWTVVSGKALPEDLRIYHALAYVVYTLACPLFTAIGVYIVGNIGRERSSIWWPLMGSLLFAPMNYYHPAGVLWSAIGATFIMYYKSIKYLQTPPVRHHPVGRAVCITLCVTIYLALWSSYVYHNANITPEGGKPVRLRAFINDFVASGKWDEVMEHIRHLRHITWEVMYDEGVKTFTETCDWTARIRAKQVLHLSNFHASNRSDVSRACRKLKREYHPDRVKDLNNKAKIQEKFIEICKSCELLLGESKEKSCVELIAVTILLPLTPLYIPSIILAIIYMIALNHAIV